MAKRKTKNTRRPSRAPGESVSVPLRPEHFINRELSWLEFNRRVLEEAQDRSTPLLERIKFLSIFSANLDEFFMVRVAGLREQAFEAGAPQDRNPDGLRAIEQLRAISVVTQSLIQEQYACLQQEVLPALAEQGVRIVDHEEVKNNEILDRFFQETVFPILTPMAIDPSHPRPRYHNRALYVVARLRRRKGLGPRRMFAVVQVPPVLPRLVPILPESDAPRQHRFIFLEDLIQARLPELFGGFDVETSATFRLTRDSDLDIIEQESDDMLRLIEERLKAQRRADAVRLEVAADADASLVSMIVQQEEIRTLNIHDESHTYTEVYRIPGPVDLTGLTPLLNIPDMDMHRDPPIAPQMPPGLRRPGEDLLATIRRRDILLHHPFDSFAPVVEFVRCAARDPDVLAIKQSVYRTSGDSPIIRSLIEAAENGKHVTALVELQARFDEQANVAWARQLERSGAHVVYGFMDLKTHCKISMIARQEAHGVRRYVHLSTGNYNPSTATIYTDLGLFTCDPDVANDASALFNLLTGYSQGHQWKKLVVAPADLQARVIQLIEEQAEQARKRKPAAIFAKLNSLVDPRVIEALYRASQAGVNIDLMIRGICCLCPGIPGVSQNIRVRSIVDRFLEHSRIFTFGTGEATKVFLSSADWMPRNFYRRVEVMYPVEAAQLRRRILNEIIPAYQRDNVKARELGSDGTYHRVHPAAGEVPFRCQAELASVHTDDDPLARDGADDLG